MNEKLGNGWGYTRRTARLQKVGDITELVVELELEGCKKLDVLLSKALTIIAKAELEIELMSDEQIDGYLEQRNRHILHATQGQNNTCATS